MIRHLLLPILISALGGATFTSAENAGAEPGTPAETDVDPQGQGWESPERQAALKVQLFLDEQGFGPGKIDARWGGFTKKAAERWNAAAKSQPISVLDNGELDVPKAQDLPFARDLLITYTVTESDNSQLGEIPESPEGKAELKELPYGSLLELVAERFHADAGFLREVNGLGESGGLSVGMEVQVPNVKEPFQISEPMDLAKQKEGDTEKPASAEKPSAEGVSLTVLRDARVVEVRREGELIHSFPITPGANDNRSPEGEWKVSVISWMPEFRWDKSMLEDGKRSDDAHFLPPGPNNPVGIVWIGLNADGIGLHGTPYPDSIGRSSSHGCIRLSNWDALTLGKAVAIGTPVTVK